MTAHAGPASAEDRLRDIQSLTDTGLAGLDDHEFLAELLDRTKAILQADTAAVLLVDFSPGHLVATAAAGLEEEVRQGVRIPVGRGFAGRIAARYQPVILDCVDHTTVVNPILWRKGIKSMVGVPLVAGGRVIGVMHVGSLTPAGSPAPMSSCCSWPPAGRPPPCSPLTPGRPGSRRPRCSAACCRPRCRRSRGPSWPSGMSRAAGR